ncbi:MAG: formylmethanofuran dehydrogenase subunit B [Pirellulales bacterium]
MPEVFHDVACTICGCVCDDLRVTVDRGRIVEAVGACHLAEPWLLEQNALHPAAAKITGRSVPVERAIAKAAELLARAQAPLIYGLSRSSTAGQRAAVRLADRLGATIDTTASGCHAPSIMALQEVGESTCTLGEIRNRADLVIYWGADPLESHPRHLERYSADPAGLFVPEGRAGRRLVVVDVHPTATSALADHFIQVQPGRDFELLWALRAAVQQQEFALGGSVAVAREQVEQLASLMRSCRCGVVFFGLGLTKRILGHRSVEALLRLVTELNAFTRFHARRMRIPGDVAGADSVLAWQTGFPFAVNLARGYPRYEPLEYSAAEILSRREADACVLVGSEGVDNLPAAAVEHLHRIPTVVLDYPSVARRLEATVEFTTAVYGVHASGTAYRMDEVPIPLTAVLETEYPTDEAILTQIAAAMAAPGEC